MATILTRALRSATRRDDEPLNVLTSCTHERTETNIAATGHLFFALQGVGLKRWNPAFASVPPNYRILDASLVERQVPRDISIDVVLSQTRFEQYEVCRQFSEALNVPHVTLEHTLPNPRWTPERLASMTARRGDINVFISEYSRDAWGYRDDPSAVVIEHGVDTGLFRPVPEYYRRPRVMAAVNDWVRRDAECGYTFWQKATEGVPTLIVGDTPGLSKAASGPAELAFHYQTSLVFANTAQVSPVPTTLLEAMACGCAVVSTRNPMVESVIEHTVNGFLAESPAQMRSLLLSLVEGPDYAEWLGANARKTIEERFGLARFVSEWDSVLRHAAAMPFRGERM